MSATDRAWRRWGEVDPYFAVLSDPRYRADQLGENRAAFFETGEAYVAHRLAMAQDAFGFSTYGRALDFGCGVGRLSLALADRFEEVTGLDVAPAMLDEARINAGGRADVQFALSDDRLSAASGFYDLVMSLMVLQHIPTDRGIRLIALLLDRVAPGGVASLHICVDRSDTPRQRANYWAQRRLPGVRGLFNLWHGRPFFEPLMQMNAYPLDDIVAMASEKGFSEPLIQFDPHGRFRTAQLLMRK